MTILDSRMTAEPTPRDDNPTPPARAISHEDLVELVRTKRDTARRNGTRIPGRPSLAKAIGVSRHRIRQALDELAREDRLAQKIGRTAGAATGAGVNGTSTKMPPPVGASEPLSVAAHDVDDQADTRMHPDDHVQANARDIGPQHGEPQTATRGSTPRPDDDARPSGTGGFYVVAAMSLLVSMDTSWRFFETILHITDLRERIVMFAVLEVAQVACGWGMRANVRRTGRPGAPRLFAWLLCALSGYMAWLLSGPAEGLARVALGPALGLVTLHLALGIEIRTRHARTSTWTRIGQELRERLLSRLGLADDERDALLRTRQRAAGRVAKLALNKARPTRVVRALRASNAAHDPAMREWLLDELAATSHVKELSTLSQPSPWGPEVTHRIRRTDQPCRPCRTTPSAHRSAG